MLAENTYILSYDVIRWCVICS